jgi:hypothetical protein
MEQTHHMTRRQLVGTGAGLAGATLAFGMAHSPARALATACATLTPTKEGAIVKSCGLTRCENDQTATFSAVSSVS